MEITLDAVTRTYCGEQPDSAVHAVRGISLHIPANDIFGIIGKSGAGKSTLVRLMSLLEPPDGGEIRYDGKRVDVLAGRALIAQRRRIGMIFQNFNLFSSRTAGGNVAYPLEICGTPPAHIARRVDELLSLVDLADRKQAPVSTLSGGQKQRVAIARALANRPDILFCDEATSALDPQTTHQILDLIKKIQSQIGLTVVMITHQMEVVRDACSRVAVIDNGVVVEHGSVGDIFIHPSSRITKSFLAGLSDMNGMPQTDDFVRWSPTGGKYTLRFVGPLTGEPMLSRMVRRYAVEFNIRAAGVQTVKDVPVGTLVLDISGDVAEVHRALAFLQEQGITVEAHETEEEH
ncbi:MAG: ATP-binding cassette domain-containing protein [Treponema sp.]|nr:ATP-binding cassette domain-containing protein [Treponema sp.]